MTPSLSLQEALDEVIAWGNCAAVGYAWNSAACQKYEAAKTVLRASLTSHEAQPGEWRTPSGADCHPESPHSISPREQELITKLLEIRDAYLAGYGLTYAVQGIDALLAGSPKPGEDKQSAIETALELAADLIKDMDGGDPTTTTGWKSDEALDVWLKLNAAISTAKNEKALCCGVSREENDRQYATPPLSQRKTELETALREMTDSWERNLFAADQSIMQGIVNKARALLAGSKP